jgi:hypothetical protein
MESNGRALACIATRLTLCEPRGYILGAAR